MGWQRMKSQEETHHERITGFMSFIENNRAEGTLEGIRIKPNGTGFFIIRATNEFAINVLDDDNKTGQGFAKIGDLVGIRKTGATKIIRNLDPQTLISVSYNGMGKRTAINPKTNKEETNPYHDINVDVFTSTEKGS